MPLNFETTNCCGDLLCVESEGCSVVMSADARLSEIGWLAGCEILQRHTDVAAVIVLPSDNWHARVFTETWKTLPSRLASLAIRPPPATCLVVRATDVFRRALSVASGTSRATLWRVLVEITKSGTTFEVCQRATADRLVEPITSPIEANDDDWLPELLLSPPRRELDWLFGELGLLRQSDLGGEVVSPADATAVLAGLWLLHGDGDASHRHSQSIEDEGRHRCGNFWHAIMHRQEPDYGNSKYWFRRIGQHPIFPELARRADALIAALISSESARRCRTKLGLPARWDPFAFVDCCEEAAREADGPQRKVIRRIQFVEMLLLLRASFDDATRP